MSDKNFEFINIKRSEPNTKPLKSEKLNLMRFMRNKVLNRQKSNQVDV